LADARDQVPSYSDSEQSKLQAAVSQPIVAEQAGFEGAAALALYATLALWVGAVAIFMIVAPRPANAFGTRRPALATTLRAFGPAAVLAAVQGVLVGVAMAVASSSGPGRGVGLVAAAVGVSLAFTALMQGLTTLLGGSVSRLTAVMVGVVAIAPGVVSSIPEPLARLADWLPTQPAHWLFHSALGGPGGVGGSIAELAAWCALGLAVTMAATAQARSITPRQFWSSLPQRT
jgi:putative membrane protein